MRISDWSSDVCSADLACRSTVLPLTFKKNGLSTNSGRTDLGWRSVFVPTMRNRMAKAKRQYICQNCGAATYRWQGQCADCGEWNTLVEEAVDTVFSAKPDLSRGGRTPGLDAPGIVRAPWL